MRAGKPILYWDTSVFLAWIKDENRPNKEMDGVNDVANKIHKDLVTLLTSTLTRAEILESTLNDIAKQRFTDLFKRKNFQQASPDERVMDLTSKIRDYYQQRKEDDQLPTLTTPDAIHLATAILYGASEFHTFDANNETRKRRALLPLNGNIAGYPLVICKPPIPLIPPQQNLFGK
jgi:predicted nucleic acid-binding protein